MNNRKQIIRQNKMQEQEQAVPSQHIHTTNSPFRGFHIALRKGGEWAQDMAAPSAPPSREARRAKLSAVEAVSSLWV
jgi:hypothetical protein